MKNLKTKIISGVIGLIALITVLGSFSIVPAGYRGIVLRLGAVNRVVSDGPAFKIPFIETVKKINVQIGKVETMASAYSKDIQTVNTLIAVNLQLKADAVGKIYEEVGDDIQARIVDPAIQEAVKATTAKFTAQELIEERPKVKDDIKDQLTLRLAERDIIITDVSIVNFDFSDSYEKATELKQVAQQDALTAKNKLEQVKYEADQRVAQAEAEAQAIRLQSNAASNNNYVQLKALEVQLEAIKKWNGQLPQQMIPNAAVPFVNLTK